MNKVIDYKNAPSGKVFLYNYKEPFMRNPKPYFGFQGVLLHDAIKDVIQCSICGTWHQNLSGHLIVHKIKSREYKRQFGLMKKTALISERMRDKLIKNAEQLFKEGKLKLNFDRNNWFKKGHKNEWRQDKSVPMEIRNKTGTCPEQILFRLEKLKKDLGRQPTYKDVKDHITGLRPSILKIYGSWKNACKILGWEVLDRGRGFGQPIWTRENLIQILQNFKKQHGREPMMSDIRRKIVPSMSTFTQKFGGFRKAKEIAFNRVETL